MVACCLTCGSLCAIGGSGDGWTSRQGEGEGSLCYRRKRGWVDLTAGVGVGGLNGMVYGSPAYQDEEGGKEVERSVNRSGELDNNNPQHSINAEIMGLEISLDEVQLQQILILWDYLSTYQLREKYGRYRPWCSPLSKKQNGWQILWWRYAQESVLSDVRKKLKRTSWRNLGQRLSCRRKYVTLYKAKLYSLQPAPVHIGKMHDSRYLGFCLAKWHVDFGIVPSWNTAASGVDENVLGELEQMEKELDIEDILIYRSAAECKLQEFLSNPSALNININVGGVSVDKSRNDEHLAGKSRGWLNWLSLGMLGAGGTDDSSQFSGVVSDEVIKDIYEATKFHPNTSNVNAATNDKIYFCAIKFCIHQARGTTEPKLPNRPTLTNIWKYNREIAQLILCGSTIECKLGEESASLVTTINSVEMLYPCNRKVVLHMKKCNNENNFMESEHPSLKLQVDTSPSHEVEFSVKGFLEPVEVTCDVGCFLNCIEFFGVFSSFESHHQRRVLSSLNGIRDANSRLQSKAEYFLSSYKKVFWDICINNVVINVPWETELAEQWNLSLEAGAVVVTTKNVAGNLLSEDSKQSYALEKLNSSENSSSFMCFQPEYLNAHYEVEIKDLEVCVSASPLQVYFSPTIYGAVLGLIAYLQTVQSNSVSVNAEAVDSPTVKLKAAMVPVFGFCVNAKFESVRLLVDLANDGENSLSLIFVLQELDICYSLFLSEECWICLKALNVSTSQLRGENDGHILLSSGNHFSTSSTHQQDIDSGRGYRSDNLSDRSLFSEGCIILHFKALDTALTCCKYTICMNGAEIHCYPDVIRLLTGFFENLSASGTSCPNESFSSSSVYAGDPKTISDFGFQKFGFSNYFETGSPEHASIPLDRFPFITISNASSPGNLESSLLYSSSDWRKYFNLRDRRIRMQHFNVSTESKSASTHARSSRSTSGTEAYHVSRSSGANCPSFFDFNLCEIRLHFHDASGIVGTVTLPSSNCSLFVYEDCMDALCSLEGVTLTSDWWTKNFHEFIWGPCLPNLSPIINVRVQKNKHSLSGSHLEVGLSLQHVYCILPPEYLAIILGYFSLPDWSSDSNKTGDGMHESSDAENEGSVVYKFEILDSVLILPVESSEPQFLKAEFQQVYFSFINSSSPDNALKGIPCESLVPEDKLAKRSDCLNIFGRDVFLSFLSFKDHGCLSLDKDANCADVTLLAPLSADIWVRLPCESESSRKSTPLTTCIMSRISECQVLAEDDHFFFGFEALLDVMNQFSLVPDQSKCFKSDVPEFLQLKRCFKQNSVASPIASSVVLTEVRCHVNSLVMKFHQFTKGSTELIAKAEMQLTLSAILRNDFLSSLDLTFSYLEFLSLPSSIVLARCTSPSLTSSVLDISLSEVNQGENELYLSIPSLDIWVHLSDWVDMIDMFVSYAGQLSKTELLGTSSKSFNLYKVDTLDNTASTGSPYSLCSSGASTYPSSGNTEQDAMVMTVKLENIGVTFHFPIYFSNKACGEFPVAQGQRDISPVTSSSVVGGNDLKYISVSMHSKSSGLLIDGRSTKLKTKMERLSGTIALSEDNNVLSWPFFQIFHVVLDAELHGKTQPVHVKVELQCDHLNVWLSHNFFYFLRCVTFVIPEAGPSQFPFGGVDFKVNMRKVSFLLSDGRWSCSGPLFEILVRNIVLYINMMESYLEGLVSGEFQVSYNNIHKVFWEPFIEPWQFEINVTRKQEMSLNSSIMTDIQLKSTAQLNLNVTEPLIECVFRTFDMIKDSWDAVESNNVPESQKLLNPPHKHMYDGRYAPYVLQNLTSLPLVYHIYKGPIDDSGVTEMDVKSVEPGASIPLYINDTLEELFHVWPTHSSDRLAEQKLSGVAHHYISIQLDGTSAPFAPISMRVGLTYFEVDFYKAYNENGRDNSTNTRSGFEVPVVFDVSAHRYSKFIRIYSTVILSNATSTPLELRFDIPFGVSPKILDPIYPGQELPLPLHLAEAGRIRWRPIGNSYLWSEVYNLSNLLLQETKVGFLKSSVCYPAHPSNDPFRCVMSVRNVSLPCHTKSDLNTYAKSSCEKSKLDEPNKWCVHQLTLCTPLVVKNYLPKEVSLAIESGGVTHTAFLSEVETFFHYVDPSHDLGFEISFCGSKPATVKFPRIETFCTMAKFSGTKFAVLEVIAFDSHQSIGPTYVTIEKTTDAFSGARELSIYVPFLLYNCTGFPLLISEYGSQMNRVPSVISSSYDMGEQELYQTIDGLHLVSSIEGSRASNPHVIECSSSSHVISTRNGVNPQKQRFRYNSLISENSKESLHEQSSENDYKTQNASFNSSKNRLSSSGGDLRNYNFMGYDRGKVGADMYSPVPFSAINELMVMLSRAQPDYVPENTSNLVWSSPFFLVPPSGSTTVLVPQSLPNAAFMISLTSSVVAGPLTGRSSAITFQPRYVISNACSKDLCFKQKGTDHIFRLRMGEHSHLHWMDTTRELLVSVRYNEPGWQWSGSFLPDHLGDTQVKMQNYVSGSSSVIRVEMQNADVSVRDEKVVGSLHGDSGTMLILLSDDDTGYMPYKIDNFSKERLRIFQQKCDTFETIVHSYTSCPYAWDEPCYPHRLTVEVPGERVLGSYSLDEVKEYIPVDLPPSSEKPGRKLVLSVHAEGATKVLRVIDSNYHILNDTENSSGPYLREKKKQEQKQDKVVGNKEQISVVIPHLGISLINIYLQELLFACAQNIRVVLLQSLDQQKLSFQISSLQIDNQLRSSPYPVLLSFDRECKSNQAERILQRTSDGSYEPVFSIAVSKVADFHLELGQELILSLFAFIKEVTSRFQSTVVHLSDPLSSPLISDASLVESSSHAQTSEYHQKAGEDNSYLINVPVFNDYNKHSKSLPLVIPIGAPWQQIYLLAKRQRKIYVEVFEISPVNLTLSFSSAPWILRKGILTSGEFLVHRGLMALADVEGAQVHLKRLTISHHISSWESIQEIFIRHCTRQLLHEMYKVFGSAGVIGNPMGFARTLGLGIRDFLSVPARTIFQSPTGLITGMAQGTTSLLRNTVYAVSDAATQFSKAAHKGIVAFTFDDQAVSGMEQLQTGVASHSKGVINEVLEGLTGLLQSPIKGAEKHGLPGVLSGIALGVTGLVAKPAASILQVTGKTAQSIRNRSRLYQMARQRFRVRFPRPLSREAPLRPYSWEEALGTSVLAEAGDGVKLKDEVLVACKALKQAGKFVVITERLILIVSCSRLVDLGKPEFRGIPADLEWVVESEIGLETVMHADSHQGVVHIVGSSSDTLSRQNQRAKGGSGTSVRWNSPTLPLIQTNLELEHTEDAENLLEILSSAIERGKNQGWGRRYLLHRSGIK
ncbi:Putative vacuolar protein sorting-associated protein 13C [Morus notabilis]|uniref:Putative vacuolar protein sorting-associated protein 13C n=1 Tax=Morus notabilis TaxID=981085 RepID=W9QCI9_9ROSA|nr:Putative vacuolar protein sorting-associated protein 13C [Morus notabilis]